MSDDLRMLDWNLLHVLHVLLEELSVARAAARLHVTASAVSNALARLRRELDDPLLVRSGRGLTATPRALELGAPLATGFTTLRGAVTQRFDARTCTRRFVLALSDADQLTGLAPVARSITARLPAAHLHVISLDTLTSNGGLAAGAADATIGPRLADATGLHRTRLFTERSAFVVRKGHPRIRGQLDRASFEAERHVDVHVILGERGSGHRAAEDAFARAGLTRTIACVVPSFAAAASVVASTDYVGALPLRVATLLAGALPLRIVKTPWPALRFEMQLYWHERTHADPAARVFRQAIVAASRGASSAEPPLDS